GHVTPPTSVLLERSRESPLRMMPVGFPGANRQITMKEILQMPDLGKLYQRPAGVAVKPKLLPAAEGYIGVITGVQVNAARARADGTMPNYEESIRFSLRAVEWPDSVDEEDRMEVREEGGKPVPVALAQKNLSYDFYDNRLDILDRFLSEGLGLTLKGRGYAEVLPEATGARVKFDVKWRQDTRTPGEFIAFADNLRGEED